MRLQILCRGTKQGGLGHLFRTRTFARAAQAETHDVQVVAIVEEDLESILEDLPCPVDYVRQDHEAATLVAARRPEILVCDLTGVDAAAFEALRGSCPLMVSLSPVFTPMDRLDAVFTRVAGTPPIPGVELFAGMQYAVFGEQCTPIDDAAYERALSSVALPIAVSMGGADAANKTLKVVRALVELELPTVIWVLLGEGYAHSYNALVRAVRAARLHEVILAKTNRSMWQIMGNCAVAILAGGLTTVEAVYAGLPSINLFERREHREQMRELLERDICLDGGYFSEDSLKQMTQKLHSLGRARGQLREIRRRMGGAVDQHGPRRVLHALEALHHRRRSAVSARSMAASADVLCVSS